jgi:hypothetical protein
MKRVLGFSMTLAAALGFAAASWAQTGGSGGAGGAGAAGAAGSAGTAGAGGGATAVGRAGTTGIGGNTGTTTGAAGVAAGNNSGVATGNNPASGAVNPGVQPGANNGIGVGNNFGANSRGRFNGNGLDNNNAAARTGRNNLGSNAEIAAANNGTGFNGGVNQTPFFNNPAVRRELNMNDTQFNGLNRAYHDAFNTYKQSVNNLGNNNNLTADQRAQQMEMLENRFNNSFNKSLDNNFTDAQARLRFEQLNRQYMGLNAFNNSAIQNQLNLTPQQRQQIRSLASQWRDQQGTNGVNPDYSQYSQQLNSILTPQQQQTWSQLTGSQFNFNTSDNGATQNGAGAGTAAGPNAGAVQDPNNNLTAPKTGRTVFFNGESGAGTTAGSGAETSSGTATGGAGTTNGGTSGTGAGTSSGTSSSGSGAATGAAGTTGGAGK